MSTIKDPMGLSAAIAGPEYVARLAFDRERAVEQLRVTALEYAFRMRGGMVEKTLSTAAQILAFLRGDDAETFQGEEEPPARRPGFSSDFLRRACQVLGVAHEDDLGGTVSVVVDAWRWEIAYLPSEAAAAGGLTQEGWTEFVRMRDRVGVFATNFVYGERGARCTVPLAEVPRPNDPARTPYQAPPDAEHGVLILSDAEAPPARVERIDEDPEDMPF